MDDRRRLPPISDNGQGLPRPGPTSSLQGKSRVLLGLGFPICAVGEEVGVGSSSVQLILTLVWALLFVPALLWWKQSVPFLVFVSVYANFVGHWAAWEAAKAKEEAESGE
jgi:hypothetical protein